MIQTATCSLLVLAVAAAAANAQGPAFVPRGFDVRPVVHEATHPSWVRSAVFTGDGHLVAIGRNLELRRPGSAPRLMYRLHAGEDFAFVACDGNGTAYLGELNGGTIRVLDVLSRSVVSSFAGVRNAFDAALLPSGDLLVSANPNWPAPGSNTGIWLVGATLTPRELLPLTGPSGPLVLDPAGDLVIAELGPIVPPPPGAARVLRLPAALLQSAIAGATLTTSQATATGTGYGGIYDLAFDDLGQLYGTDPQGGVVRRCATGSLSPSTVVLDVGPGRFVLHLGYAPHPTAPFRGYQPPAHAPALFVSHSDFAQSYEVARLEPARPRLGVTPTGPLPPGVASLHLTANPPNGLAAVILTLATAAPETVVTTIEGVPLWLGIPSTATFATVLLPLDANGAAATPLLNPGGHAVAFTVQTIALGAPGTTAVGSSLPLQLQLIP